MADEPETQEQYQKRRADRVGIQLARELIDKVNLVEPRFPDENEHRHMRIDVYPRPVT